MNHFIMTSIENPEYFSEEGMCAYVSGKVRINLRYMNQGGVNVLREITCSCHDKGHCNNVINFRADGLCGYFSEYDSLGLSSI